jgi:pimeloyl-ACP methyl ester carboxylesterase
MQQDRRRWGQTGRSADAPGTAEPDPDRLYLQPLTAAAIVRRRLLGHPYNRLSNIGARRNAWIGFAATDVRAAVLKDSGHWIMEEQPEQAVSIILSFLDTERSQG